MDYTALENLDIWREAAEENRELRALQLKKLARETGGTVEDEQIRRLAYYMWGTTTSFDEDTVLEQLAYCEGTRPLPTESAEAQAPSARLLAAPRVAMLTGETFARAFSAFSELWKDGNAVYFSSLNEVLEETAAGAADLAILPLEDAKGNRFLHFEEEFERLDLHLQTTVTVIPTDGERGIRFGLLSKARQAPRSTGEPMLECSVWDQGGLMLNKLLCAARAAGLSLSRVDTLPSPHREGIMLHFATFCERGGNTALFLRYLTLFLPNASVSARYVHLKGEEAWTK